MWKETDGPAGAVAQNRYAKSVSRKLKGHNSGTDFPDFLLSMMCSGLRRGDARNCLPRSNPIAAVSSRETTAEIKKPLLSYIRRMTPASSVSSSFSASLRDQKTIRQKSVEAFSRQI